MCSAPLYLCTSVLLSLCLAFLPPSCSLSPLDFDLSVRPFACPSVRPSVRPSVSPASATSLVRAHLPQHGRIPLQVARVPSLQNAPRTQRRPRRRGACAGGGVGRSSSRSHRRVRIAVCIFGVVVRSVCFRRGACRASQGATNGHQGRREVADPSKRWVGGGRVGRVSWRGRAANAGSEGSPSARPGVAWRRVAWRGVAWHGAVTAGEAGRRGDKGRGGVTRWAGRGDGGGGAG